MTFLPAGTSSGFDDLCSRVVRGTVGISVRTMRGGITTATWYAIEIRKR